MQRTLEQYDKIIHNCKEVFLKKTIDYGTAWRILRPSSLTDQLYIKASRIRSLEENEHHKVDEGRDVEYLGLVNYCIMAMIQLDLSSEEGLDLVIQEAESLYDRYVAETRELMIAKNHDYGEAWREMRTSSLTDLILMKLLRVKQIEDNDGKTLISEGLKANYQDIANYSIFALIKMSEVQA